MAKLPEIEEFAKKVSDLALDEFEYEGKTIREWAELILNGNLIEVVRCKDCKNRYEDSWCDYVDDNDNFYCARGKRKEGAE